MGTIIFFFKEAIRGFYQAKLMTFVSIVSIAVSLCIVSLTCIAFMNLQMLLRSGTDQTDIAAYINESVAGNRKTVDDLIERIRSQQGVSSAVLIDKDSAWKRFSDIYGKEMLNAVDENPLPASIEIRLTDEARSPQEAQRIADAVADYSEIESVRYSREWIKLVERFRNVFGVVVLIIAVIMVFMLYFMIANTIKLTIYARKELIAHMQVVGATAFFIKMPFLLEGILQGVVGGIVCLIATTALKVALHRFSIYWGPPLMPHMVIFTGILFGWLGSSGAVRKFLS
jgi:cell division transport system permease protein